MPPEQDTLKRARSTPAANAGPQSTVRRRPDPAPFLREGLAGPRALDPGVQGTIVAQPVENSPREVVLGVLEDHAPLSALHELERRGPSVVGTDASVRISSGAGRKRYAPPGRNRTPIVSTRPAGASTSGRVISPATKLAGCVSRRPSAVHRRKGAPRWKIHSIHPSGSTRSAGRAAAASSSDANQRHSTKGRSAASGRYSR